MKRIGLLACLVLVHCHADPIAPRAPTPPSTGSTTAPVVAAVPAPAPTPTPRDVSRPVGRGSLAGTIRDGAGKPIAGARACAETDADALRVCVVADPQGAYRLEVTEGRYTIDAMADRYAPARYKHGAESTVLVGPGMQQQGLDIALEAGAAEVTGTVRDATGAPIRGAKVAVRQYWGARVAFTETDAAGHYAAWMPRGDILVSAEDERSGGREVGTAPSVIDIATTPDTDGAIAGRVIEAAGGTPIAGIHVVVAGAGIPLRDTTSDAQGHFVVAHVGGGRYRLLVRDAGLLSIPSASVVVRDGETTEDTTVLVRPGPRLSGKVVIDETGAPCDGARVVLADADGTEYSAISDPIGGVRFGAIAPGVYQTRVYCAGHHDAPSYPPLTIADSDVSGVVWQVVAGVELKGRVRSRRGVAVAGAWVSAYRDGDSPTSAEHATTAADGTYVMTGLRPGTYNVVISNDVGAAPPTVVTIGARGVTKDLVVSPQPDIRGVVVDGNGAPLPRVAVRLSSVGQAQDFMRKTRTFTAPDGAFVFPSFPPGNYTLRVDVPWSSPEVPAPEVAVTVRAPGSPRPVKLVLVHPSGTIRGTVVDARGAPVRNAEVAGSHVGSARTGADGSFTLTHVPPGKYSLSATRDRNLYANASDVEAGATLRLQLPDPATVEGVVTLADGSSPDEIAIDVVSGYYTELIAGTEGHFTLRGLVPGRIALTARAGTATGRVEIDVPAGTTKRGVAIVVK